MKYTLPKWENMSKVYCVNTIFIRVRKPVVYDSAGRRTLMRYHHQDAV